MEKLDLKKMAVARRVSGSNGGIFIIKGDFNEKFDLINEIELELQINGIKVTAKTCVIDKLGCIFTIDLHINELKAVTIVNKTLKKFEFYGYKAQTVTKPNNINYFEYKTIDRATIPNGKVTKKTAKTKVSKSKKEPIPLPYSY